MESCGTREWLVFRGIYKGGLWEDDLHVSALVTTLGVQTPCLPSPDRLKIAIYNQ